MPPVAENTNGEKVLSPLPDMFIICLTFLLLMCDIVPEQWGMKIGLRKQVKHPNIKEHMLPIRLLTITSRQTPSSLLAIAKWRSSHSNNGWRAGSISTSQHTSLNRPCS